MDVPFDPPPEFAAANPGVSSRLYWLESALRTPGMFLLELLFMKAADIENRLEVTAFVLSIVFFLLCPLRVLSSAYMSAVAAAGFYFSDSLVSQWSNRHIDYEDNIYFDYQSWPGGEQTLLRTLIIFASLDLLCRFCLGQKLRLYQSPLLFLLPMVATEVFPFSSSMPNAIHFAVRAFLLISCLPTLATEAVRFASFCFDVASVVISVSGHFRIGCYLLYLSVWRAIHPLTMATFWIISAFYQSWLLLGDASIWRVISATMRSPVSLVSMCTTAGLLHYLLMKAFFVALPSNHPIQGAQKESGIITSGTLLVFSTTFNLLDMELDERALMLLFAFKVGLSLLLRELQLQTKSVLLELAYNCSSGINMRHHKAVAMTITWLIASTYLNVSYIRANYEEWTFWKGIVTCPGFWSIAAGSCGLLHYCVAILARSTPLPASEVRYRVDLFLLTCFFLFNFGLLCLSVLLSWNCLIYLALGCIYTFQSFRDTMAEALTRQRANFVLVRIEDASVESILLHNDVCPVCLAPLQLGVKITPCRHLFHTECLRPWFYNNDNCPLCKEDITTRVLSPAAAADGQNDDNEL